MIIEEVYLTEVGSDIESIRKKANRMILAKQFKNARTVCGTEC